MPNKFRYSLFWVLLLVASLLSCSQSEKKHRILVIQSYESDYPAYKDFNRKISDRFKKEGIQAEIRTFYLNSEQYNATSEEYYMYHSLDTLTEWKPDLIMVNEDQATYTLMTCKHPFVKTVPIVFSGVNFPDHKLLKQYPNATGFWDKPDYLTNVRLMEKILGKITIFMLHDSTFIDKKTRQAVHEQVESGGYKVTENAKRYAVVTPEIQFDYETSFLERPDSTLVNIIPVQGDRIALVSWYLSNYSPYQYYLQAKRDFRVLNTSKYSSKPSFSVINKDVGYTAGLVGGYITSLDTQINESVHQAAQILDGKPVNSFPTLSESAKDYVFNYQEIEAWKLDTKLFPENAVYLNRPFRKHYPMLFWTFIALGSGAILTLIASLLIMYTRENRARHNAQKALLCEKESLAEALEKAKESDKMKSVFLANMSHEIRTPLNAIVGFSSLIADLELEKEEKTEYSNIIKNNNELLLKLINDILDLSRIESGHMSFTFSDCNLSQLLKEVYKTYQAQMPGNVELRLQIPSEELTIKTDQCRLEQIINNFINNAIKFTTHGYIKIGYTYEKQEVCFYVEDTGKGIPENQQSSIFERFNKLDEFVQGTGLGLPICKVIAERFGGTIHLKSAEGKGSTFSALIPYNNEGIPKDTNTFETPPLTIQ